MPLNWRSLTSGQIFAVKCAVFAGCVAPLVWAAYAAFTGGLGADPVEALTRFTGETALKILVITLALTPLRLLTGVSWPLRMRRMLGLFMAFYALLHAGVYFALDRGFDLSTVIEDIVDRKYITVGFAAFVLLIPLAATSNNFSVRRLGGRVWQRLHRSVYAVAALAVLHFLWLTKGNDYGEPLVFLALFAMLFAVRLHARYRKRTTSTS